MKIFKDPFIIAPKTFELIQELQSKEVLQGFNLVGGTALALQMGHRNSIDIDLFTLNKFNDEELLKELDYQENIQIIFKKPNTIISLIYNIKTDFIRHDYPLLKPIIHIENIRMLSMEDISAMKVHAIVQSGKRLKDFIDIYFLLEHFSLQEIVDFFTQKYNYITEMVAFKALNYFDDLDFNLDPPKLIKPLPIEDIKERIVQATLHPNRKF